MTCAVCKADILPHQCAHAGLVAVCFGCGTSSYRPAWEGEDRPDADPAYVQLSRLSKYAEVAAGSVPMDHPFGPRSN